MPPKHTPLNVTPQGLIPAFNALGNHPEDLGEFLKKELLDAYTRLNIVDKYDKDLRTLLGAIKALNKKRPEFEGHHITNTSTRKVMQMLIDTFTNVDKCNFYGQENYKRAINLTRKGHNVLIIQNHTSGLDALVAEAVVQRTFGKNLPISYIISQVFEYARITAVITSGIEKFSVFQPKHIAHIRSKGEDAAAAEMVHQNKISLRALSKHACKGGKIIFLYPEKNRTIEMGEPEPIVMKIPELLDIASPKPLYILPTYVTGLDTILPNRPGTNELDDIFKNINVGQGDMYCGAPIEFSKIQEVLHHINQDVLVASTLGKTVAHGKSLHLAALSILMVGIIANTGPNHLSKGIYDNSAIDEAVAKCLA